MTHDAVGVVVLVLRADGTPAVIKVSFPQPGNVHEPDVYAAWGGRGAALATVRDLGQDQSDTLVHGDLHFGNVLRADREPRLAIDPKGWAGDPAWDAAGVVRTRLGDDDRAADRDAAVLRRLDVFAEAAGADRERVRRRTQVRVVTAAHWGREHGDPAPVLAVSEALAVLPAG